MGSPTRQHREIEARDQARAEAERAYRRTYRQTRRPVRWRLINTAIAVSAVITAAIWGVLAVELINMDDDDDGGEGRAETASNSGGPDPGDGPPRCGQLSGLPTVEVLDGGLCVRQDGQEELLATFSHDGCPSGEELHWNDRGWGYSDGTWQNHSRPDGQLVPPEEDLQRCMP